MQQKLEVADCFNKINRLKEEEDLLLSEIKNFIEHFRTTIPNHLWTAIQGTLYIPHIYQYVLFGEFSY